MARYDFGVEKRIYVPNLEEADVNSVVKELVEQAHEVNAALPNKFWSNNDETCTTKNDSSWYS